MKSAGYNLETMWECAWCSEKENLSDREEIEQQAKQQTLNIRDALFGGRTEGFKRYHKCKGKEVILVYDVSSLYPTVNALDDYAVGFKRYVITNVDDIRSGKFFGLAKVDIVPPKSLKIHSYLIV